MYLGNREAPIPHPNPQVLTKILVSMLAPKFRMFMIVICSAAGNSCTLHQTSDRLPHL